GCGLSIGAGILLRPDGGILLAAVGGYLFFEWLRSLRSRNDQTHFRARPRRIFVAGLLVGMGALAPLVPWTVRNLHNLHRFEPLPPRYANDADEPVMTGFNRWVRTWMAEYVSVQEIYWNVPGEAIDATRLPNRAFDTPAQKEKTIALIADYNKDRDI